MNLHGKRLGKVQAKDAHDGLGIDGISAGGEVNIKIAFDDRIDKSFDIIDGFEHNHFPFHINAPSIFRMEPNFAARICRKAVVFIA
jgi:hypothetical protein